MLVVINFSFTSINILSYFLFCTFKELYILVFNYSYSQYYSVLVLGVHYSG